MVKIKHIETGVIATAIYWLYRGKMVYWVEVNGEMTPFPDRLFDKTYVIISRVY